MNTVGTTRPSIALLLWLSCVLLSLVSGSALAQNLLLVCVPLNYLPLLLTGLELCTSTVYRYSFCVITSAMKGYSQRTAPAS